MSVKSWGGRREGAGRKAEDGATGLVSVAIKITEGMAQYLYEQGNGNSSLGARMVISKVMFSPAPQSATKVDIPKKAAKNEYRQRMVVTPYPGDFAPDGTKRAIQVMNRLQAEWKKKYPTLNPDDH